MTTSLSERILATPSAYAKANLLYVQEIGTLKSLKPHVSRREKLESYLFFTVTEGRGFVTTAGITRPVRAGDCIWLNCRDPYSHESSADAPWTLQWVHFNGEQADKLYQLYTEKEGSVIFTPSTCTPYTEILQSLYRIQQQKSALSDLEIHKFLTDLVIQIFKDTLQDDSSMDIPEKFIAIRNYIEENHTRKVSLDELSECFYISKYHLLREYQRLFGITVSVDLTMKRLAHAKKMLRFSDESIESIALTCGFQTASYFIKVFKQYENLTPLEYRKKW